MEIIMGLLHNTIFLLLLVIIIGGYLGKLKFKNFSLGSSAIIFVALVFGHFGMTLPREFQTLGLVLFIYSIGLQAGPGFLTSFKQQGLNLSIGAAAIVFLGFVSTLAGALIMNYNASMAAGIFAGALTSTPGLAVAVEFAAGKTAPTAYGVTYAFGVVGVILFVKLIPQIMRVNIQKEEELCFADLEQASPKVVHWHLEISNPNLFGKLVRDIHLDNIAHVSITRLKRADSGEVELCTGNTVLNQGDHIRVVGTEENLKRAELFLGKQIQGDIQFQGHLTKKKVLVTKREYVGKSFATVNFRHTYGVQVARITRNGIDLPAIGSMDIHFGDILHVVGPAENLKNVSNVLGDDVKAAYGTDVMSIIMGMCLGFLLGMIPIPLPVIGEISLGTTGGVLLAGLVLGYLHNTGPIVWEIPVPANNFIRELGLVVFLATVGTRAGETIVATVQAQGLGLFLTGIMVTLVPLVFGFLICRYVLKIRFLYTLGVITGGITSTPGLASTQSLTNTPFASSAYATVYPVALVGMILGTKFLVIILTFIEAM